ncbi:MAG: AAA family ATPase [Planctomycetia bacterium]|nr:AAA family ATPase [Planctomycetia bacterium]
MYELFFGLRQRPFAASPLTNRYFPASSIDDARQTLARCIERAEGMGLVIGGPGTGKSLVLALLAEQFAGLFTVISLSPGHITTRRELLQAILYELKAPCRGLGDGDLWLALLDHLRNPEKCPRGALVLVDEAHALAPELLDELRIISNVSCGTEPQARLVLAGGLGLEEHLARPQLEALSQRFAARCYLTPFDRCETIDYVRFQLAASEGQAEAIFEPAAAEAVHQASDGIPRLVNQLCDHALMLAWNRKERPVTAAHVREAWSDLQQLPTPWTSRREPEERPSVVEFGALVDDATAPAAINLESDPEQSLTDVETRLADLEIPAAAETPPPVVDEPPPVTPSIPEADPFAGFGEEVVLHDRYATLDSQHRRGTENAAGPAAAESDAAEDAVAEPDAAPVAVAAQDAVGTELVVDPYGSLSIMETELEGEKAADAPQPDGQPPLPPTIALSEAIRQRQAADQPAGGQWSPLPPDCVLEISSDDVLVIDDEPESTH